jgi:hypothetical protein
MTPLQPVRRVRPGKGFQREMCKELRGSALTLDGGALHRVVVATAGASVRYVVCESPARVCLDLATGREMFPELTSSALHA